MKHASLSPVVGAIAPINKRRIVHLLGALALASTLNLQPSPAFAQGTNYALLTTITNPTPALWDYFGDFVAPVGNDRLVVGAMNDDTKGTEAGAAYLYTADGVLLTVFFSPAPASYDNFGVSAAGVGSDRVIVGAPYHYVSTSDAGAAYLFSTDGTALMTFTDPVPQYQEFFGMTVAGVGSDKVLIGAPYNRTGATGAGAAFLFSTNGALITTFTNPAPELQGQFARSLAALGTDRVVIAAPMNNFRAVDSGVAYLFRTDGTLLTTLTNPTPAADDAFGWPLTAVGTDMVLVGCAGDDGGGDSAGAAYLFNTNGVLLRTFTSPSPTNYEVFGASVAAVGTDRVLIGAHGNSVAATYSGVAYLFSTNGTLLTTFTNPTPAENDHFGQFLTATGTGRILIASWQDDTWAVDAGATYLYGLPPPPSLSICFTTTNTAAVSWPSASTGWTLQQNTNGLSSVNWSNVSAVIQDDGTNKTFVVDPHTGVRFYRLIKP